MAITCKDVLFWGFELLQRMIFLYRTTLMSAQSLHMTYMTSNDGADRTLGVCVRVCV